MRGTAPIITCDDEHSCDEWEIDYWVMGAMNWQELLAGWKYDPYNSAADILCTYHAKEASE